MVTGYAIHAGASQSGSAKNIAPANNDADAEAQLHGFADFSRDSVQKDRVNTVVLRTQQRFTAEFQQYALIWCVRVFHGFSAQADHMKNPIETGLLISLTDPSPAAPFQSISQLIKSSE